MLVNWTAVSTPSYYMDVSPWSFYVVLFCVGKALRRVDHSKNLIVNQKMEARSCRASDE
jgi:hypothetical protein